MSTPSVLDIYPQMYDHYSVFGHEDRSVSIYSRTTFSVNVTTFHFFSHFNDLSYHDFNPSFICTPA